MMLNKIVEHDFFDGL